MGCSGLQSVLSLAVMINTKWLHVFLVELGNVVCPALKFQGDGLATGIFLYQYSFVWMLLPNDAATRPSCATSCVVTYEEKRDQHSRCHIMITSRTIVCNVCHKGPLRNPILQQFRSSIAVAQVKIRLKMN